MVQSFLLSGCKWQTLLCLSTLCGNINLLQFLQLILVEISNILYLPDGKF